MHNGIQVVDLIRAGRFPFQLAIGALILIVVLGVVLTILQVRLDLSSRTVGMIGVPVFLGALGVMAWFAWGPQGTVTIYADELRVDPRGRAERRISLPADKVSLMLYTPRDRALIPHTFGPLVRLEHTEGDVSFAAPASDIRAIHPPADDWSRETRPPDYFVSLEGLTQLLEALGIDESISSSGTS